MIPLESIRVVLADTPERWREGMAALEEAYRTAFAVTPSRPDFLFVAYAEGAVVGTIGVQVPAADGLELWPRHGIQSPAEPERSVEVCRWTSVDESVSFALIRSCVAFCLSVGAIDGWCEQTLSVNRRTRRFGIDLRPVPRADLVPDRIPPEHRAFYDRHAVLPYRFCLRQARAALEAYGARRFAAVART